MEPVSGGFSPDFLQVRLLGAVELTCAGANAEFPTRKSRSIFAFLAINRRKGHPRELLAEAFWPDCGPKRSRAALRTELWRIRDTIARAGADPHVILTESADAVRILPKAPCRVDVDELDDAVRSCAARAAGASSIGDIATLEAALQLYTGDLLEGEDDEWCVTNREYYRSRYFTGLVALIETAMALHDWRRAIEWGERLLLEDPLAEHVHRYLMICHNALGNRPAAIRQFARCTAVLRTQLNVGPMEITSELHRHILQGMGESVDALRWQGSSAVVLKRTRESLIEALRSLDAAIDPPRRGVIEEDGLPGSDI